MTRETMAICQKHGIDHPWMQKCPSCVTGLPSLMLTGADVLEATQAEADSVNHPSHYTAGKVECIEALEAATTGLAGIEAVCTANAIKYLWRWKQKNGTEDLKKARWYINRLLGEGA